MNSNEIKKSKEEIELKNNTIVNRMMIMFGLATAAVVALLLIKRSGGATERIFVLDWLFYLKIASGILLAGAIVYFAVQKKRNVDESLKMFSSITLLILTVILFSICMLYQYFGNMAMVIIVIGALVLSFVYNFYQRDYFYYSVFTVINVMLMYLVRTGLSRMIWKNILIYTSKVLIFVIPVIVVGVLLYAKVKDGAVKFNGKSYMIMKPSYLYLPFYIGAAIAIIAGVVGLFLGSYVIYLIIAQLAVYLLFGIIYTIKMI